MDNLESNFIGQTFCRTRALSGKEIYVLNSRYKVRKNQRSWVGSDSDFMFTLYIIPRNNKLQLEEVQNADTIISNQVEDLVNLSKNMSRAGYDDGYDFLPIIKINNKYFKFINCSVQGQAFNILEDFQYFPKYGDSFNRYELNLLSKPYSRSQIDSISLLSVRDSTAIIPFMGAGILDFYDKWYISKIDKKNQTIDFWAKFQRIPDGGNFFGKITSAITYKINVGITDFYISPFRPDFSEKDTEGNYSIPIKFNFVEFVDLKKIIPLK